MPSKDSHVSAAKRNQSTIEYLLRDDAHLGWAVTVAFYKALHIVEAVLATKQPGCPEHTDDHKSRNKLLKTTIRFQQIWKMYRPLYEASLIARYLRADDNGPTHEVFDTYMPRKVVESMVMNHYLAQIEKSAATLVNDPALLK